ncbi:probable receptor-like protein kinase At5g38990 [Neltuma alba]|uniref:probable receptor-like protein kinase At5g38990 n=1 Tax=Neltuma alba TaxID=207710 RepID=UPI0010A51EF6|nr:probable receptor-like protein kinase At5g38990 [Prosopis alba]
MFLLLFFQILFTICAFYTPATAVAPAIFPLPMAVTGLETKTPDDSLSSNTPTATTHDVASTNLGKQSLTTLFASLAQNSPTDGFFAVTAVGSLNENVLFRMTNSYPPTTAIFFLLLFRNHFTICVSYNPVDHFAISCGSSDNSPPSDGRNWTADSGRFSLIKLYDSYKSSVSTNSLVKTIPYNTARFSLSEFSYFLPVRTNGQKFIRLYFYPSSHARNLLRSDSFFSVTVGSHTLLKDFNASITADAAGKKTILLEYCVHIGDPSGGLNITFTPNPSHQNSYAFVNGIEVVSMPTFLYYTNLSNSQGIFIQYPVTNDSALQTAYRINVGGRQIPPENDTGMFRRWDLDKAYLKRERPRSVSAGHGLKPIYTGEPSYFTPDEVYMTARNYGTKETSKFNVTWEFEVDLGFIYMVRLHFCEFDENIEKVGDRVFQIFINDALVEAVADVMSWTQSQRNVPVHRDYQMWMPMDGSSKKLNISIKLQPEPTPRSRSTYRDVLLNGIEILKISDFNNNLGGPNPDQPPSPSFLPKASNHNAQKRRVISILVGSASGFIVLSLIVLLTYRRFARLQSVKGIPSGDQNHYQRVGGFGNVYKGQIDNGSVVVAIKRLKKVHNKAQRVPN